MLIGHFACSAWRAKLVKILGLSQNFSFVSTWISVDPMQFSCRPFNLDCDFIMNYAFTLTIYRNIIQSFISKPRLCCPFSLATLHILPTCVNCFQVNLNKCIIRGLFEWFKSDFVTPTIERTRMGMTDQKSSRHIHMLSNSNHKTECIRPGKLCPCVNMHNMLIKSEVTE